MVQLGLFHVRTEFQNLLVRPSLAPHPEEPNGEFSRHHYLRDGASSAHCQVQEVATPVGIQTYRVVRRFNEQKAQQPIALFADVPSF